MTRGHDGETTEETTTGGANVRRRFARWSETQERFPQLARNKLRPGLPERDEPVVGIPQGTCVRTVQPRSTEERAQIVRAPSRNRRRQQQALG